MIMLQWQERDTCFPWGLLERSGRYWWCQYGPPLFSRVQRPIGLCYSGSWIGQMKNKNISEVDYSWTKLQRRKDSSRNGESRRKAKGRVSCLQGHTEQSEKLWEESGLEDQETWLLAAVHLQLRERPGCGRRDTRSGPWLPAGVHKGEKAREEEAQLEWLGENKAAFLEEGSDSCVRYDRGEDSGKCPQGRWPPKSSVRSVLKVGGESWWRCQPEKRGGDSHPAPEGTFISSLSALDIEQYWQQGHAVAHP